MSWRFWFSAEERAGIIEDLGAIRAALERQPLLQPPPEPNPARDADLIHRVYRPEEDRVVLQGDAGTITGTRDQVDGLASEHARRQRGDKPQFYDGEIIDI